MLEGGPPQKHQALVGEGYHDSCWYNFIGSFVASRKTRLMVETLHFDGGQEWINNIIVYESTQNKESLKGLDKNPVVFVTTMNPFREGHSDSSQPQVPSLTTYNLLCLFLGSSFRTFVTMHKNRLHFC